MQEYKFSQFFWQISRAVLTPILVVSILIFADVYYLSAEKAVSTYHSYPYMFEHVLCGIAVYLAFSIIITKIHRSLLHDR